jgi:hypothetical protein
MMRGMGPRIDRMGPRIDRMEGTIDGIRVRIDAMALVSPAATGTSRIHGDPGGIH